MPHLTLTLSNNINTTQLNLPALFQALHHALLEVPGFDITTCHSGIIQQDFSYIGLGDERSTKVYLELVWLDKPGRMECKPVIANTLMQVLEEHLRVPLEKQNLFFSPRIRIGELGQLDRDYYISHGKK